MQEAQKGVAQRVLCKISKMSSSFQSALADQLVDFTFTHGPGHVTAQKVPNSVFLGFCQEICLVHSVCIVTAHDVGQN